ncbi:hypothetical protein BIV60_03555 [Bacillus sp. MUM 116]|uniref:DUF4912 domain-containing protein n=1 Tax=Bacillus sp. MUM 116 TaxID=1678002 RepID=UPI0008F5DB71|nr:DUF4912 domain-containing protein [Bacillus sp. MUM 116]OIK16561.1 hypothetical protein BIV60_03555 [Bacillus sp. MUM 116]
MIEEIIKLREEGLSFRKIASELDTTVGKVQYRWNKWISSNEKNSIDDADIQDNNEENKSSISGSPSAFVPVKGKLTAKLINPQKIIILWEVSELPQNVIQLFFDQPFDEFVSVVRIYDVTDLRFNGINAHHFYEIAVPYKNSFWYIKGLLSNRHYIAELGVKLGDRFFPILRSNTVQTPSMETTKRIQLTENLNQLQKIATQTPKWIDHVSTYSYYAETDNMEENNE